MSKIDEFLEMFEVIDLTGLKIRELLRYYQAVNNKRSELEGSVKKLKAVEDTIKGHIGQIMKDCGQTSSGKTEFGEAHFRISNSITTKDAPVFIEWLRKNPDQLSILGTKPYTQDKMKEMIGYDKDKELPDLPPGTEWYREQKVVIKK